MKINKFVSTMYYIIQSFFAAFLLLTMLPFKASGQMIINSVAGIPLPAGYNGDEIPATAARLYHPYSILATNDGTIYFTDSYNRRIRKITPDGIIHTVAGIGGPGAYSGDGGPATNAQFIGPGSLTIDNAGNLYVIDNGVTMRKIDAGTGIITRVVGDGSSFPYAGDGAMATASGFMQIVGNAVDAAGNIYFGDNDDHAIRKVNTAGIVTTIAGTGIGGYSGDGIPAVSAQIFHPTDIALDNAGNIYFNEKFRIRKINTSGIISTIAGLGTAGFTGDGGPATAAQVNTPDQLYVDDTGTIFFSDTYNRRLRRIDTFGIITTIAGTGVTGYTGDGGPPTAALLGTPTGITTNAQGHIYYTDNSYSRVRKIYPNRKPLFTAGEMQQITVCQGSTTNAVNTQLAVIDTDAAQALSWAVLQAPLHGTAVVTYGTVSTGGIMTPAGLSYSPTTGYSGVDTFKVTISDGYMLDTTTIAVTVLTPPSAGSITGPSTVCVGATIVLSHGTAGGAWSSSASSVASVVTGTVSGNIAGTAVISYTHSNSCGSTSAIHTVTVNDLPSTITGTGTLCTGSSETLVSSPGSGTWSSSFPGTVSVDLASGMATGGSPGSATITYTLPTGCWRTTSLAVIASVNPISGTLAICDGNTTTLLCSTAGGVWSSGNTLVASIGSSTGIVSPTGVGLTAISYVLSAGCYTTSQLTVNALPTPIIGALTVCETLSSSLTSSSGGTWNSSNSNVAVGSSTGIAVGNAAGTSSITFTLPSGCFRTATMTVNANPSAITGILSVCESATTTLSNTSSSGTWSSGSANATVDASGNVLGNSAGTAIISYTLASGCAATVVVTVNVSPGIISGATEMCMGAGSTLSNPVSGGVWMSGATTATINPVSGDITTIAAGTATIQYTLGSSCSTSTVITINNFVASNVSVSVTPGSSICSTTGAVTFTALPTNGGTSPTYQWLVNGTVTGASSSTLTYVPANGDIVVGMLTSSLLCASPSTASDSVTMTVAPSVTPSINVSAMPNDTVCTGESIVYSATGLNGGTSPLYQWRVNGVAASTSPVFTHMPVTGDVITCDFTSNAVCRTINMVSSAPQYATVLAPAANTVNISASSTVVMAGHTLTFVAIAPNAEPSAIYQWLVNSVPIPGATLITYSTNTLADGDVVHCKVTTSLSCLLPKTALSGGFRIKVTPPADVAGIESNMTDLTLLPNPTTGMLTLCGKMGSPISGHVKAVLVNTVGQVICCFDVPVANGNVHKDMLLPEGIAKGYYWVRITGIDDAKTFRILVE